MNKKLILLAVIAFLVCAICALVGYNFACYEYQNGTSDLRRDLTSAREQLRDSLKETKDALQREINACERDMQFRKALWFSITNTQVGASLTFHLEAEGPTTKYIRVQ